MRHLIWMIRSAFCKHEWEFEEKLIPIVDAFTYEFMYEKTRRVADCKKCGWHRSYWKY